MSFYRIYRPQILNQIDNEKIRQSLSQLLGKDKKNLPHAYLFTGPKGAGKTTAARLVAKIFNCIQLTQKGPCGECGQCKSIAQNKNLDILEMDAASNRGIDEIRSLRESISLAPVSAEYKVYIIDEVHMLTSEAFNALLKTLEEPPGHAIFILATTDAHKVPVTIKSRCMVLNFSRATVPELNNALQRIVAQEKINIDPEALNLICQKADGSFRDAVKYLEQASFHKGKISVETVETLLALAADQLVTNFLAALSNRDAKLAFKLISDVVSAGVEIKTFLTECLNLLEQKLIARVLGNDQEGIDREDLQKSIQYLSRAYGEIKSAPIAQLPLELAVVEFCQDFPPKEVQVDQTSHHQNSPPNLLTLEKLAEHWTDFIAQLKPYNHSVAGVLRSTRPKGVDDGIVTIEAFYSFHKEKLNEPKIRQTLADVLKKLFGEQVKVEIVLGKK